MKKIFCFVITLILISGPLSFPAMAETGPVCNVITYTEYCDDGSYFVVEVGTYVQEARASSVDGYKTSKYYNRVGVAIWDINVHGTFSYTSGVSAEAASASCTVTRYDPNTELVSKNAYVSGASAVANATVKYLDSTTYKTVTLTCDKYGKLS